MTPTATNSGAGETRNEIPAAQVNPSNTGSKVRMALVGLRFGANIGRALKRDRAWIDVVAVCDRDLVRGRQIAEELGVPLVSWEQILQDPAIEAVGLFTGPVQRAPLLSQLIAAGKHVMTTKPFEVDLGAAKSVLDEAQKNGTVLHLNSPAPKTPADLAGILAWQKEFNLGAPVAFQAATWASYHEKADGSWYDSAEICGAAPLLRLGIYFFNDFVRLAGDPDRIHVVHSRIRTGRPTADQALASLSFKQGAIGSIFASFCVDDGNAYRDEIVLNYQNATIRRWMETQVGGPRAVTELKLPDRKEALRAEFLPNERVGSYQWEAFFRAIRGLETTDRNYPARILDGLALLDAAGRSFRTGSAEAVGRSED
jgi:predicted dehydrogenase